MSLLWNIARVTAVLGVLTIAYALLPDAPETMDTLTIPDVIWDPLVAVLQLDRYFPISTLIAIASLAITIKVGMAGLWLYSWISRHVFGGS